MTTVNPQLAVSTWSLHRLIDAGTPLLDIPAQAAAHGLGSLEICHFHFPTTDAGYLAALRGALSDAGVSFLTMLIDTGDPTHPDPAERRRQLDAMASWLDVAAQCGAKRARVIAGDAAPTDESMALSVDGMRELAARAEACGFRLEVENWHRLLDRPAEVLALLETLDGRLGLKLDFGNWPGPRKYDDLPQIARLAETTHAKAYFTAPGQMDREDFTRCLNICRDAGFAGPHSLIFDGPIDGAQDEWASLDQIKAAAQPYLKPAA